MKFIIAQGNRKRELVGPFGITASREDFTNLRDQIDRWLADDKVTYGWLTIQDKVSIHGPLDTAPEPWDDTEQCKAGLAANRYMDT